MATANGERGRLRRTLMHGAAGVAAICGAWQGAAGQEQSAAEVITVTASRVQASGFTAPTPVTVVGEASLKASAPVDISEALTQIPQFNTSGQSSTAVQYANLRNLGAERTLVLLDGRRHVPTFSSGVVDLTTIPTALIARTEMVTGGASASWGSDAVSGVVNMILKSDLEGVEGSVQFGESSYGDDQTLSASLAGGFGFADGRGHLIAGAEYAKADGIPTYLYPDVSRPWGSRGFVSNSNYSTGLPQIIYADDVRRADVHDGGLITSGPLRGTIFLPGGQTGQFGYGQVFGNNMIGGTSNPFEPPDPGGDVKPPYERTAFLARGTYEFTPSLEGFLEYNYSSSISDGRSVLGRNQGSIGPNAGCTRTGYSGSPFGNINVSIDNAFLPDAVVQQMVDAGISCFNFGRSFREDGMGIFKTSEGSPDIHRGVAGLSGDLFGGWTWDAYVQHGDATFQQRRDGNIHRVRFQAAIDAVVDPGTGQIVCRINIDASAANDDPACVPFNMFGAGSPSAEAQAYVTGVSALDQEISQSVAAFNVQGDLFSTWAGPIGAAAGLEYREEEIFATVDPDSQINNWQTSNRKGIEGSYDVREVYGELVVPLAVDAAFADSINLNLAARLTDYSTSGEVTTWKVGATWDVNEQLRFRATQSRDIRAGNLGELFTPTAVALSNVVNPATGVTSVVQTTTSGNPTLDPEEADTFTVGVVVSPRFFEGFQASVDYYSIEIQGQIGTVTPQNVSNLCFRDNLQQFCDRITVDSNGVITAINNSFANLDRFETSGVDIETAYRTSLDRLPGALPGDLSIRVLSSYVDERKVTFLTDGRVDESAGEFLNPHWKVFALLNYSVGPFGAGVDWRWYGGGKIDNDRVEGLAGPNGVNVNDLAAVHYTSLNFTYDFEAMDARQLQLFARIDNVFDKAPPSPLRAAFNDNNGRGYRAGVRFAF